MLSTSGMRLRHRHHHREGIETPVKRRSSWRYLWLPVGVALLIYCNSLNGQFVHDDLSAITANADVTGSSSSGSGNQQQHWTDFLYNDFWGTNMMDPSSHKSYRPLTILTFKWNYAMSGLNPWSYHVVNVMLHSVVVLLVAWLCRHCLGLSSVTSSLAAFLFAIHPIHTEAVSGIVGRADILTTLFSLLSFISYDRAASCSGDGGGNGRLVLLKITSLLSALFALAAKENGIAALPVAITWDVIRHRQHRRRHRQGKLNSSSSSSSNNSSASSVESLLLKNRSALVSITTTAILLVTRIAVLQGGQLPSFSEQDNPAAFAQNPLSRILTLLYLPAFNMGLLLAPVVLSYDWQNGSIPLVDRWFDWRNAASILFYTLLTSAVLYSWLRRKRVILWSLAVMIWPMLPASNLFYPCGFVVAERLLYLPSVGYCIIVSVGLTAIYRRSRRRAIVIILIVGCFSSSSFLLAAKTWTRNADWTDRKTLFESGLRTLPNNAKMWYNYGNVQKDHGRWQAAIDHYRQAIELWPSYASALNNLGTVLLARADEMTTTTTTTTKTAATSDAESLVNEAENRFHQAIRYHPQHLHAHYNLAVLYMQRNETEQSMVMIRRCLTLNPHHRDALQLMHWITATAANNSQTAAVHHQHQHYVPYSNTNIDSYHRKQEITPSPPPSENKQKKKQQQQQPTAATGSYSRRWNKTA